MNPKEAASLLALALLAISWDNLDNVLDVSNYCLACPYNPSHSLLLFTEHPSFISPVQVVLHNLFPRKFFLLLTTLSYFNSELTFANWLFEMTSLIFPSLCFKILPYVSLRYLGSFLIALLRQHYKRNLEKKELTCSLLFRVSPWHHGRECGFKYTAMGSSWALTFSTTSTGQSTRTHW